MNSAVPNGGTHSIGCVYCRQVFDLFVASWCRHRRRHPSKICPACSRCLCGHPLYGQPDLWREAPLAFRKKGFAKLFVLYV